MPEELRDQALLSRREFGRAPGTGVRRRASEPPSRARANQRLTLTSETSRASAMSRRDQPRRFRCNARNLRHSRPSAGRESGPSIPLLYAATRSNLLYAAISNFTPGRVYPQSPRNPRRQSAALPASSAKVRVNQGKVPPLLLIRQTFGFPLPPVDYTRIGSPTHQRQPRLQPHGRRPGRYVRQETGGVLVAQRPLQHNPLQATRRGHATPLKRGVVTKAPTVSLPPPPLR